jgi:RNA polymerase sigma-70 factor (ECF subfamily)
MDSTEAEFQKIYEDHYPSIVQYLRRLVGESEAEDVAQEVFVKVHQSLDGFRGESKLSTWIYRIATNTAMDRLRSSSSKIQSASSSLTDEDDPANEIGQMSDDNAPRLDTLLIRKDMNDCIRGIVDSLPENYRTVLVLSDMEGLTNAEICEVLRLSLETVKIRLHRGRKRLQKELETNCHFYRDERNELACDRKAPSLKFTKK